VGNVLLLVLNLPLIGLWVKLLKVPSHILQPLIVLFAFTGTYAASSSVFDLHVMVAFGVLGYVLQSHNFPVAPIVLGLILGPSLETNVRRALIIARGDWAIFFQRPIAATLLVLVALYLALPLLAWGWRRMNLASR
jgi:putative tricarboxylic transport membrane protein